MYFPGRGFGHPAYRKGSILGIFWCPAPKIEATPPELPTGPDPGYPVAGPDPSPPPLPGHPVMLTNKSLVTGIRVGTMYPIAADGASHPASLASFSVGPHRQQSRGKAAAWKNCWNPPAAVGWQPDPIGTRKKCQKKTAPAGFGCFGPNF